jgi:hypothetical protein
MLPSTSSKEHVILRFQRLLGIFLVATVIMFISAPLAKLLDEPAFASWGMLTGLMVYGCGVVQILRRMYFPYIDLRIIVDLACKNAIGAGLTMLGVCFVVGCLIISMGGLLYA